MLLQKQAPLFSAPAVIDGCISSFSLQDCTSQYKLLLFYPLDFTFICPTELLAFQKVYEQLKKYDTTVVGISVDSVFSHFTWVSQPLEAGGIAGVRFPLVSDLQKSIARSYGVLDEESGMAVRALFVLDRKNVIKAIHLYSDGLGRSVEEALRLVQALQYMEKEGLVCPANWKEGSRGIAPEQASVIDYICNGPLAKK